MPGKEKNTHQKDRAQKLEEFSRDNPCTILNGFNWAVHWVEVISDSSDEADAYACARTIARAQARCRVML